jgi:hypothetical protein
MIYHLVCHRHFFFLYRVDSNGVILLGSERHWEPLVTLLLDRRATNVHILDNWETHTLKIETASRPLAIHEYAQWCWQKWRHIRQNALFATARPLRPYNSILIAASPSNSQWIALLEKLDECAIGVTMSSYPMALILRIHAQYSPKWTSISPPLLVVVDRGSNALLAFLLKGRLVFVRSHVLSSAQDIHGMGAKNAIMDVLRYLEKTFETSGIAPIFFLEDPALEDLFRGLFPSSTIYFPGIPLTPDSSTIELETSFKEPLLLPPNTEHPAFDQILLPNVPRMATMHLQGGVLQRFWVRRLVPYIRLINILAIIISIYSVYTALCLLNCNQKMGRKLDDLNKSFRAIQTDLSKMPISSDPILQIQSIRKHSENQYKALIQHFSLLEHILNDRCLIRMISISPKKTRISLQIIDPTVVIDDLMDMGQSALSDFHITLPPHANSPLFVVETKSPICYEKKSD